MFGTTTIRNFELANTNITNWQHDDEEKKTWKTHICWEMCLTKRFY